MHCRYLCAKEGEKLKEPIMNKWVLSSPPIQFKDVSFVIFNNSSPIKSLKGYELCQNRILTQHKEKYRNIKYNIKYQECKNKDNA